MGDRGRWPRQAPGLLREIALAALIAASAALLLRLFVVEVYRIPSGSMVPALLAGDLLLVWKPAYGWPGPLGEARLVARDLPRRGDVVAFRHPREPDKDYVKRVVGLPGDVIEIRRGVLLVNGVPQPRSPAGELRYEERSDESGRWWSDSCSLFRERLAVGPVAPPRDGSAAAAEEAWSEAERGGVLDHDVLECRRPGLGERQGPFERVADGHLFVLGDNRGRSQDSRSGGWQVPLSHLRGRAALVLLRWHRGEDGLRIERLLKTIE